MVEQASTYTNIDMARKYLFAKGLFDEMIALTKVALYQHISKHIKAHVCGSALERGN